MKQVYQTYQCVKFVDKEINQGEADNPAVSLGGMEIRYPYQKCINDYARAKNISLVEAKNTVNAAVQGKYLLQVHENGADSLIVHPSGGRHILDTVWFIPDGLIDETLRQFSAFWQLVTGAFFLAFLEIIWHIIKLL